jgi:hypothetical protein
MGLLDLLAESRIAAAIEAGAFDDLPGAGKPLVLDDAPLVPDDLRVAHRILRNAGFLPPELAARRRACARLALLEARAEAAGRTLAAAPEYRDRLAAKLART